MGRVSVRATVLKKLEFEVDGQVLPLPPEQALGLIVYLTARPGLRAWIELETHLGIPREQVYNQTMYILVGMLVVGLICNLLVRPLDEKWFMTPEELAEEKRLAHEKASSKLIHAQGNGDDNVSSMVVILAWAAVGLPLAWGVYRTLLSVAKFFA